MTFGVKKSVFEQISSGVLNISAGNYQSKNKYILLFIFDRRYLKARLR